MKGLVGFLMRYADEIPISKDKEYMNRQNKEKENSSENNT